MKEVLTAEAEEARPECPPQVRYAFTILCTCLHPAFRENLTPAIRLSVDFQRRHGYIRHRNADEDDDRWKRAVDDVSSRRPRSNYGDGAILCYACQVFDRITIHKYS